MAKRKKMFDEALDFGGKFGPPKPRKKKTTVRKPRKKLYDGDPIFAGRIGPHKPKKTIRKKKSLATPLGFGSSGLRVRSKGKKNLSTFWHEPPKAKKKKSTKKKVEKTYTQKVSRSGLKRGTILIELDGPDLKIKTSKRKTTK
jgi:hypothetical protein